MDTDMSAYFDVVEEKPVSYPHEYKYPEGKFELALSIIIATVKADISSPYYTNDSLEGLNLNHMDVIENLQRTYDELKRADRHAALTSRKYFYKTLREITGFSYDKKGKPNWNEKVRVVADELEQAAEILDEADISYELDSGGRFIVFKNDLKRISKLFSKYGIYHNII